MKDFKKYTLIFLSSIVISFMGSYCVRATVEKDIIPLILLEFIGPFIAVFYTHYLIEEETLRGRLRMSVFSGAGFAGGAVLLVFLY